MNVHISVWVIVIFCTLVVPILAGLWVGFRDFVQFSGGLRSLVKSLLGRFTDFFRLS